METCKCGSKEEPTLRVAPVEEVVTSESRWAQEDSPSMIIAAPRHITHQVYCGYGSVYDTQILWLSAAQAARLPQSSIPFCDKCLEKCLKGEVVMVYHYFHIWEDLTEDKDKIEAGEPGRPIEQLSLFSKLSF